MAWLQFILTADQNKVDICSECLMAAGAAAVTLQPADNQPLYEPLPGTTPLWDHMQVIGLFDSNVDIPAIKKFLKKHLDESMIQDLKINTLEDRNWTNAWIDQFQPMRFGKKLMICPSWCETPDPNAINIMLDPGLAFGTGTHATTRLCLEWLDAHPPHNAVVIDYGCGSGILGIAALKLGASKVVAIDYDLQALESTKMNAEKNGYSELEMTTLLPKDLKFEKKADLLLANILANPLIELAPIFANLVRKEGTIVLSGILENQFEKVYEHFKPWFKLLESENEHEWLRFSAIRL